MKRTFTYQITNAEESSTILNFLKSQGYSRHILTGMKQFPGSILNNGVPAYGNTRLKAGDLLTVHLREKESDSEILPVNLPFGILYEDEDILVVNKPADMPIHPSMGNPDNTLANAVAWYYQQQGETFVYRCLNRLDRDTTGALILAKNALSAALLSASLQNRQVKRTYLAIVKGTAPRKGVISAPIARKPDSVIERQVDFQKGESAVTHYQRLAVSQGNSLMQLNLETGRTHQIRVHMKYLGYPLLGDYLYYPEYQKIIRQALHSYQLSFPHPITKKPMLFTAPVPEDFYRAFIL